MVQWNLHLWYHNVFCFCQEQECTVSVISNCYVEEMLDNFSKPRLNEVFGSTPLWFQEYETTVLTTRKFWDFFFSKYSLSLRSGISWSARSPHPSPFDYFLWGYLKTQIFKLRHFDELINLICYKITSTPAAMTRRYLSSAMTRQSLQKLKVRLQEGAGEQGFGWYVKQS